MLSLKIAMIGSSGRKLSVIDRMLRLNSDHSDNIGDSLYMYNLSAMHGRERKLFAAQVVPQVANCLIQLLQRVRLIIEVMT